MKRRVKPGLLELDYRTKTLLINYEVHAQVEDEYGDMVQQKSESHVKKIRLTSLTEHTDVELLADDIVAKNKLIHPAKLPRVEQLLLQLQEYILDGGEFDEDVEAADARREKRREKKKNRSKRDKRGRSKSGGGSGGGDNGKGGDGAGAERDDSKPTASMEDLDGYMEKLYSEEMRVKAWGTSRILVLARDQANLGNLAQNDPLMGALSRVFKEDYKKSMDLCLNLGTIFCCFSNFSQMHGILMSKGVGAMTMKVIELEIKRYELRMAEMKKMERAVGQHKGKSESKSGSSDDDDFIKVSQSTFHLFFFFSFCMFVLKTVFI